MTTYTHFVVDTFETVGTQDRDNSHFMLGERTLNECQQPTAKNQQLSQDDPTSHEILSSEQTLGQFRTGRWG